MAIKGLSMSEREEIILPSDPGHPDNADYKSAKRRGVEPEKPTKFFIKPLSKGCRIELGDMGPSPTMRDGSVTMELRGTKRNYALVERSLVGWENFTDDNGKTIPFNSGTIQTAGGLVIGAAEDSMARLNAAVFAEMASIIMSKNGMSRELLGNSEVPLPLPPDQISEDGAATNAQSPNKENAAAPSKP